jgi:carbon storage regulator
MLVLSRKRNESIVIDGTIRITVVGIRGQQVRLGIEAPVSVGVFREELWKRKDHCGQRNRPAGPVTVELPAAALST